jgi:hypothetical protein
LLFAIGWPPGHPPTDNWIMVWFQLKVCRLRTVMLSDMELYVSLGEWCCCGWLQQLPADVRTCSFMQQAPNPCFT